MKRILSILFAVILIVCMVPLSAYAEGDGNMDGGAASVSA